MFCERSVALNEQITAAVNELADDGNDDVAIDYRRVLDNERENLPTVKELEFIYLILFFLISAF